MPVTPRAVEAARALQVEDEKGQAMPVTDQKMSTILDRTSAERLAGFLKDDGYLDSQKLPLGEHSDLWRQIFGDSLHKREAMTWQRTLTGHPVLYDYTLSMAPYAARVSDRCLRQRDILLLGRPFDPSDLDLFGGAAPVVENYSDWSDGQGRFRFRCISVYHDIIFADPLDSANDNAVFFHRDSTILASYLMDQVDFGGRHGLDFGTGSGIQTLVASRKGATMDALDVNPRALEFGMTNLLINGWEDRTNFRIGDGSVQVSGYDFVISNPPYMYSPNTRKLSLYGGGQYGLGLVVELIEACRKLRVPLIMIFATPTTAGRRLIEDLVGADMPRVRFSEVQTLSNQVPTHAELLGAGFDTLETLIVADDV